MEEAMEGVGERVGQMMESEAGREPEDDIPRRRAISMEDLRRSTLDGLAAVLAGVPLHS